MWVRLPFIEAFNLKAKQKKTEERTKNRLHRYDWSLNEWKHVQGLENWSHTDRFVIFTMYSRSNSLFRCVFFFASFLFYLLLVHLIFTPLQELTVTEMCFTHRYTYVIYLTRAFFNLVIEIADTPLAMISFFIIFIE